MRIEIIRADDPKWDERLGDLPCDVYHTAGFHRAAEISDGGEAFLAVLSEGSRGLAWPHLLRRVREVPGLAGSDAADVTSVYGYPGPLAWGCEPGDAWLEGAWSALLGAWREARVVSVFTRFHPLLRNDLLASRFQAPLAGDLGDPVTEIGLTVSIDCEVDDATAEAEYDEQVRKAVARSRRDGYETTHDEDWSDYGAFRDLYRRTMLHNEAAAYYHFTDSYFDRLRSGLTGHAHLLITRREETVAAAGIVMEYGGIVQTYLSASDREVRPSAKPLFYDDVRRWARARGNRVLHLGGGRGSKDDSLLQFKARFSSRRHPFSIGRWVLDAEACRELTSARTTALEPGVILDPEYFPPYRSPLADADPDLLEATDEIAPGEPGPDQAPVPD